ncbi:MAG TPA: secretin N-terminal domain-containing protein [Gammaproteobacteria bacterium]
MKPYQLPFLLLLMFFNALYASGMEVIQLRNQTAEELIPIIRPLLGDEGVVTGSGYKLIVRAPAHRIEEIRKLLDEIDKPIQQLLISVRQDQQSDWQGNRKGISGNVGGDNGRIVFGQPTPNTRGTMTMRYRNDDDFLRAQTGERNESLNENISQQVRAMSGSPAWISVGVSRPVPGQQIRTSPDGVVRTYTTYYDDVATGFYVTPKVNGNRVTLEIYTQREQPAQRYRVESARLSTTVSGNIGEWISLGGSDETSRQSSSQWFDQRNSQQTDLRNISVKVTYAN